MTDDSSLKAINIADKAKAIDKPWNPKILAELNGQHVKLARFEGEFQWHSHEHEDEMFLVVSGVVVIQFRTHEVQLSPGEFCVVPRGVEHCPLSSGGAEVLMFEPASTVNTGDSPSDRTVDAPEWI